MRTRADNLPQPSGCLRGSPDVVPHGEEQPSYWFRSFGRDASNPEREIDDEVIGYRETGAGA